MSPHCPPPLRALPPQIDTHMRPPIVLALNVSDRMGERGQRGWEKVLFQVGSYPFPWSGMASQPTPPGPTASSPGLGWSCSGYKLPHGLRCCFTSAEDLAHGICKCNTCRRLKHTHPGRGKHISTEACSLPGTL